MHGFFFGALTVIAVLSLTRIAFRFGRYGHRYGGHGHFGRGCGGPRGARRHWASDERFGRAAAEVVKRKLGIDEEQEPIVDHALGDLRAALTELGGELKGTRAGLADAFREEAVDEAALAAAFGRHDDAVARARRQVVSALKQIHAVLEPEQRARAADWLGKSNPRWA